MADTREPSPRSQKIYRGGQPEKDKDDKTKTPGEVLEESGDYLKDPETEVDTSQPLEASGMPPELGTWDPNKARRDKKINERAQSQQQGSDIAKKKQTPEQRVNLPPFMEASGPDYAKDTAENQDFDKDVADAMQESEWRKRVDALIQAGIKAGKIVTPQGQLEMVSQAALLGGAALLYFTQTASQLMLIR